MARMERVAVWSMMMSNGANKDVFTVRGEDKGWLGGGGRGGEREGRGGEG